MATVYEWPGPEPERPTGFNIIGGDELFVPLPPIRWVCQGLLMAPGAPILFGGFGGSGKTFAVQALALSVATGRTCWGKHSTALGRVLHLDYEQGRRLTLDRYQRLAHGLGVGPQQLAGRLDVGVMPALGLDPERCKRLGHGRTLVIVDSWRAAHPKLDENSSEVRQSLDAMGAASEVTGCTFLFLHHARKNGEDLGKYSVRGSGGFVDGTQTLYLFHEEKAGSKVVLERDRLTGRKDLEFSLRFDDVDARQGIVVRVEEPEPEPSASVGFDRLLFDVLECLREHDGASGGETAERVGRRKSTVIAALESLVQAGTVRKEGRGPATRYYRTDR